MRCSHSRVKKASNRRVMRTMNTIQRMTRIIRMSNNSLNNNNNNKKATLIQMTNHHKNNRN